MSSGVYLLHPITELRLLQNKMKERKETARRLLLQFTGWNQSPVGFIDFIAGQCVHTHQLQPGPQYIKPERICLHLEKLCGAAVEWNATMLELFSQKQPLEKNTKKTVCCSYVYINNVIGIYSMLLISNTSYGVCHGARICFTAILNRWPADGPQGSIQWVIVAVVLQVFFVVVFFIKLQHNNNAFTFKYHQTNGTAKKHLPQLSYIRCSQLMSTKVSLVLVTTFDLIC